MEGSREWPNPYPDWPPAGQQPVHHLYSLDEGTRLRIAAGRDQFLQYLEHPRKFAEYLGIRETLDRAEDDVSVYTGQAGLALLYMKLGQKERAADKLKHCLRGLKKKRFSFLCGDPGPLSLAAVLAYRSGDRRECDRLVKALLDLSTHVRDLESDLADELLYGRAGYLYSLLYLSSQTEDDIGAELVEPRLLRKVVESLIQSGRRLSNSKRSRCPLLYEWHGKRYYGAAHGLAGIYSLLLQARECLTHQELNELVKPSVDYLMAKVFPSGNYPSSEGSENDRLVHWCHGAPGVIHMLLLAYKVWQEQQYLTAALKAGDVIWTRGLLRKGFGLCHGVAGNGYGFLHLYQTTQDTRWLYRAVQFGEWCLSMVEHWSRTPDRPLSLYEGLAGTVHYLDDLLHPDSARFPAFLL